MKIEDLKLNKQETKDAISGKIILKALKNLDKAIMDTSKSVVVSTTVMGLVHENIKGECKEVRDAYIRELIDSRRSLLASISRVSERMLALGKEVGLWNEE